MRRTTVVKAWTEKDTSPSMAASTSSAGVDLAAPDQRPHPLI